MLHLSFQSISIGHGSNSQIRQMTPHCHYDCSGLYHLLMLLRTRDWTWQTPWPSVMEQSKPLLHRAKVGWRQRNPETFTTTSEAEMDIQLQDVSGLISTCIMKSLKALRL
ncbi:hypothetical protein NL676_025213 [Syzygium grande]|nr:hypothetical protein NL676_025213 [Syzygium grande]